MLLPGFAAMNGCCGGLGARIGCDVAGWPTKAGDWGAGPSGIGTTGAAAAAVPPSRRVDAATRATGVRRRITGVLPTV
jgi:hypothetical protein